MCVGLFIGKLHYLKCGQVDCILLFTDSEAAFFKFPTLHRQSIRRPGL